MTPADDHTEGAWMQDRIEAYLDGDLSASELEKFERLLSQNIEHERELAWAVNVRDTLRATPETVCPPDVVRTVMREVRKERWSAWIKRIGSLFSGAGRFAWKPALATAVLLVAALAMMVSSQPRFQQEPEVSQEEIEQALADVKWTLGYVSKTGRLTGSSVQDALTPLRKAPADK